ncbi:hypothetical protein BD770DRAFT_476486 [Pilaira anomala]|nr:hypothetical protein BD770DRAFT_476486 [Pilaira anomala]
MVDDVDMAEDDHHFDEGIVPGGPKKTYDLVSFLKPFIDKINDLRSKGIWVEKNGEVVYVGKVFILSITDDIPGIASLINHPGHHKQYTVVE